MHLPRPGHAPNRRSFEVRSRRPKRRQIVAGDGGRANLGQHGEQGVLIGRGGVHDLQSEGRVVGREVDDHTGATSLFSTRAGGSRYTFCAGEAQASEA